MISKELLREVLAIVCINIREVYDNEIIYTSYELPRIQDWKSINIHELAHKNLKQWAKLKNVFDIIDWSEEPEQIFKKAEELRNEIN